MRRIVSMMLVSIFLAGVVPAYADSQADMMEMLESMKQQMNQMQQTINQQNQKIEQLENRSSGAPASGGSASLESPSITADQMSDSEWKKGIKDNVGDVVTWLKGLKFGGDLRLRYEAFDFQDENNSAGANDRSRNRFRVRLRYGFEKDFGDDWKVGFRMATGTPSTTSGIATDNTSPNVTLGNPGYYTSKNIYIDKAFAAYTPNGLKDYGMIKGVTISGGKFDNPFLRYSTFMQWDGDINPEGAYEKADLQLLTTENNQVGINATAGQFIINENTGIDQDTYMTGYQGALTWSTYAFNTDQPVEMAAAVSYYDYVNLLNTLAVNTTGVSFRRTNTTALDNPRILDFYPEVTFYANRVPITLFYNYIVNMETDGDQVDRNPVFDSDTAWGLGFKIGKLKNKGDWEFQYGYYVIGADAVVAAFSDSDFGGPGGAGYTNRRGHKWGLGWQVTKNGALSWTAYLVEPEDVTTLAGNALDETVFRSQLDFLTKF